MGLEVRGANNLSKNLSALARRKGPPTYAQIILRAIVMVENASAKLTPVKTGHLRDSGLGNVKGESGILKESPDGAVGFTANTAEYALYVHERADLKHKKGKTAFFLQKALQEVAPKIERMFGVGLRTGMFSKDMVSITEASRRSRRLRVLKFRRVQRRKAAGKFNLQESRAMERSNIKRRMRARRYYAARKSFGKTSRIKPG
jgi:hypothetical protein